MSQVLDGLFYTREHLWVLVEDSLATVGLSDHGQHFVGDVTIVELPDDDREVNAGDEIAAIQGRDDDLDVCAPVSGTIVEVNQELEHSPEIINQDTYGMGWLFKIEMNNPDDAEQLLSAEDYEEFLAREEDE